MSWHSLVLPIGGTALVTLVATAWTMNRLQRHRKDDKTDRRLEKLEQKLENLAEAIHAHDLKAQSIEHAIQRLGEKRADKTYRSDPDGPQS